jgi:hypothetical protein
MSIHCTSAFFGPDCGYRGAVGKRANGRFAIFTTQQSKPSGGNRGPSLRVVEAFP